MFSDGGGIVASISKIFLTHGNRQRRNLLAGCRGDMVRIRRYTSLRGRITRACSRVDSRTARRER